MELIRRIGHREIIVDTDAPCDVFLEQSVIPMTDGSDSVLMEKKSILRALANRDEYFPLTLHWELHDRCNLACPFCYIVGHSFQKIIRLPEIHGHLEDLVNAGLLFCTLTGGEAIVHPDFPQIYRFLKESGVIVDVFTNGIAVDSVIIDLFSRLPPAAVEVSIYTLDDERMRGTFGAKASGTATRVLNNILRMQEAGIRVACKTFASALTIGEITQIERWCAENRIQHYTSSEFTQAYDGADLRRYALPTIARTDTQSPLETAAVCLPCGTKNYGSAINAAFEIYPCASIKLRDCTFDLRTLGVAESLRRMVEFMRCYQDQEIRSDCNSTGACASCMAYAKPVRNEAGALLYFAQP